LADGPDVSKIYLGIQEAYFRMTWIRRLFDHPPRHQERALAAKGSPRRNTAHATLAGLLANAMTTTLRWARLSGALAYRPSGVSSWAIEGSAARAVDQQLVIFIAPLANDLPPVAN
jgi:hypothetical protein